MILVFFVGLAVLSYPALSNYWNERAQSRAIVDYEAALASMVPEDYSSIFAEAEAYNEALQELQYPLTAYGQLAGYNEQVNVSGNGLMGYITIDAIDVQIPMYHGTSDAVLNVAVGHLEGSSLPVGGEGSHAVLSAHRGLPSARLFTDLDELLVGDEFSLTVLDRQMTYRVSDVRVVEPHEIDSLSIEADKDLVTLFTCTPYGINTHRILVRGERVLTPVAETIPYEHPPMSNTQALIPALWILILLILIGFVLLVLLLLRLPAQTHAQTVVDLDRRGSLTLRLKDLTSDEAIADAEIRLYALASLEIEHGEASYRWSQDYRDLAEAAEELSSATLAEQMAHRALDQALPLQSKTTGAEGDLTFSDLPLGLYLLIQTGGPDSHYPMEAFLLALSLTNEAGTAWLYDVTAYPKVEARPETTLPTEPSTPSEPAPPGPTQPGSPDDGGLIITGASNWLVILLSAAGLSLMTLGWILRRKASDYVS